MIFNSLEFVCFLPIVFFIYWAIPKTYRWIILLVSSYYFYMSWNAKYVFLIFFTSLVSFICAIMIENRKSIKLKKQLLLIPIISSLGILFIFKYFNFFFEMINSMFLTFKIPLDPITLNLLLPVGISFYTFQTLSYVIDVYRGNVSAERHLGKYLTFISYFPQLVAGPIERTSNLLPQIKKGMTFEYELASYGVKLMTWGFFKKIIIADTLGYYVNTVWSNLENYSGFSLVIIAFFFSIQIYCDFSGYSDIAIGTSKLFGIDLMNNFKSPYFSKNIKEFWSRWHISLSTWFKDYVYIPLGGNRCSNIRNFINVFITFSISGLWHGASFTYLVWGMCHGALQGISNVLPKKSSSSIIVNFFKCLITFSLVTILWVIFRSENINQFYYIISNILSGISSPIAYIINGFKQLSISRFNINLVIILTVLFFYDLYSLKYDPINAISKKSNVIKCFFYVFLVLLILTNLPSYQTTSEFIYFQF